MVTDFRLPLYWIVADGAGGTFGGSSRSLPPRHQEGSASLASSRYARMSVSFSCDPNAVRCIVRSVNETTRGGDWRTDVGDHGEAAAKTKVARLGRAAIAAPVARGPSTPASHSSK
jgi:hypothetical protein